MGASPVGPQTTREYWARMRERYERAGRDAKGGLLDEVCEVTGYHRKAVIRLLRRAAPPGTRRRRGRRVAYSPEVVAALRRRKQPRRLGAPARRRQRHVARAMEPQQQAAADRIAERPVRLPPLPRVTDGERQRAATPARRGREQRADRGEIGGRDRAAAMAKRGLHGASVPPPPPIERKPPGGLALPIARGAPPARHPGRRGHRP